MAAYRHQISSTPPILAVFARRVATRLSSTHSLRDTNRTRGYDTYVLPGRPAKQIHVDWTGPARCAGHYRLEGLHLPGHLGQGRARLGAR